MFHALTQQHVSTMHLHATSHSATMPHATVNHMTSSPSQFPWSQPHTGVVVHHPFARVPPHPHPPPSHPHPPPSHPHPPPRTPIPGDPYYPHPHLPPTSHGITLGGYIPPPHPHPVPSGAYPSNSVIQSAPHVPIAITGGSHLA